MDVPGPSTAPAKDVPKKKKAASPRKPAAKKRKIQPLKGSGAAHIQLANRVSKEQKVVMEEVRALATEERDKKKVSKCDKQTLASLGIGDVTTEVDEMGDDDVCKAVTKLAIGMAQSIMAGQGYEFKMPSRAQSNQLYVKELDRIVLKNQIATRALNKSSTVRKAAIMTRVMQIVHSICIKKIHITKRDLFYSDPKLFVKQSESDPIIEDVACMLGCTRTSLNVVASEKGVVIGRVTFKDDGDFIDCCRMGVGGKAIPALTDRLTEIKGDAEFILLVEKDAAFMRLSEDRFYNTYPCIIITAKGQPDIATRLFLSKLKSELNIPILGLVDSDPYGLKILSVYMSGSKSMSYDSSHLTTSDIKWLGVRPSDLERYKIPEECRLDMTEHDIATGKALLQEDFIKQNPEWTAELELMLKTKVKAEIQALSMFGFQYLTKTYLPLKLQEGDWI